MKLLKFSFKREAYWILLLQLFPLLFAVVISLLWIIFH
jgi:hypothetical protein